MKHLIRFVAALGILVVPAAAHAQVSGGVRVGANLADLAFTPSPPIDSNKLTGLVAGAFVTIPVTDMFAFQPEALYSMQGTKFSEAGMTAKIKIDYVQVPLLAHMRVAKGSPVAVLADPRLASRRGPASRERGSRRTSRRSSRIPSKASTPASSRASA